MSILYFYSLLYMSTVQSAVLELVYAAYCLLSTVYSTVLSTEYWYAVCSMSINYMSVCLSLSCSDSLSLNKARVNPACLSTILK